MIKRHNYPSNCKYEIVPTTNSNDFRINKRKHGYIGWIHESNNFFFARHIKDEQDVYKRFCNLDDAIQHIIKQDQFYDV